VKIRAYDRNFSCGNCAPIQIKASEVRKKKEREKLLLFKRQKVVKFLISPNKKRARIEVNKKMNPALLFGIAFNNPYWHRKYHSGTICKGVSNAQASNALSGCEREEIPNIGCRKYKQRTKMRPNKSLIKMKGKNGSLLLVEFLKGLLEERKWR